MKYLSIIIFGLFAVVAGNIFLHLNSLQKSKQWELQSIDTMKQSRDLARYTMGNEVIRHEMKKQVADIAKTGATHLAIGTPYDSEFIPVLKLWVEEARKQNLNIFFRGNFSGWEQWFGYEKMSRQEHIELSKAFIEENSEIFEDGDIFSSCPECENGEIIDRENIEQIESYKAFLIREYAVTKQAFQKINKKVKSNYFSMNGDMAFQIMDPETTKALDGIVVIDHYVKDPEKLDNDVTLLAEKSGGKIVLGEFGAPIPDIHGNIDEKMQKEWIDDTLSRLANNPHVVGVNYWVSRGGSTAIWSDYGNKKPSVNILSDFFKGKRKKS
jgi:hypothetical protein